MSPGEALAPFRIAAVSPDGMNLYVAGQNDHSVVELHRAVVPSISAVQPAGGPAAGGTEVAIQGSGFKWVLFANKCVPPGKTISDADLGQFISAMGYRA